jgi:hypothetical protein
VVCDFKRVFKIHTKQRGETAPADTNTHRVKWAFELFGEVHTSSPSSFIHSSLGMSSDMHDATQTIPIHIKQNSATNNVNIVASMNVETHSGSVNQSGLNLNQCDIIEYQSINPSIPNTTHNTPSSFFTVLHLIGRMIVEGVI